MKKNVIVMLLVSLMVCVFVNSAAAAGVTLKVWDQFTSGTTNDLMDEMCREFENRNPGVSIEREAIRNEDLRTLAQVALASGTGPDVLYYDTGAGFGGVLARAGLLLPLENYYKQFGWDDRIFEWTKERTTYGGRVYGIGHELEFYGVYYNTKIFEKLGLSIPNDYDEFVAICETLKSNGYIPISFANQGGWPAYHMFSVFANNIAADRIDEILFGDGRWDEPEIVEAIRLPFSEMASNGYFIPGTNGVAFDDGNMLFYTGKAAMHITGTWMISGIEENCKPGEIGFFFFPSIKGSPVRPAAGLGSGYFISSKTAHPELAAKFLDFLFSEEMSVKWLESGEIPPMDIDVDTVNLSPLLEFALEVLTSSSDMGHNIDVLTPQNFNEVMNNGFQAVIAGLKTPEEQAADLQAAWDKAKEEGLVLGQ